MPAIRTDKRTGVRPGSDRGQTTSGDAAPFDSVPGIGFDSDPVAAAIVPPPGQMTGRGPAVALDPAQNNTFRALNAAWKSGASVRLDRARGRYIVTGAPASAVDGWVK